MPYILDDTIAAIASPPGGAARGIVRLSGPDAVACVEPVFSPDEPGTRLDDLRRATVVPGRVAIMGPADGLPCDLYVWPDARSYTRQPTIEIHAPGSPSLLESVLAAVASQGARPAEPGEFTLRAFLSGRLDLTRAEAVLGVIDATNRRQFSTALAQLAGGLGRGLTGLRDRLLDLLAHLEAGLDFAEEDIEFISTDDLTSQIAEAHQEVAGLLRQMHKRGQSGDICRVVLRGEPNVGKSSLFNALVGRDGAIVSETAGTTRDYLTARIEIDGLSCELIDTAGRQKAAHDDDIARMAGEMTARSQRQADVELLCLDSTRKLTDWERNELPCGINERRILVMTKVDEFEDVTDESPIGKSRFKCRTSSVTGEGLQTLRAEIRRTASQALADEGSVVGSTAVRCRESLRLAESSLKRAHGLAVETAGEELVAAELRVSLNELGKTVGAVVTDDVLDRIFSRFCIGK